MYPSGSQSTPLARSPAFLDASLSLSALDEVRFGIRTARAHGLTASRLPDVLLFCQSNDVRLLIARSQGTDAATMRVAQETGLRLMDVLMYWMSDLRQIRSDEALSPHHVRPLGRGEAELVRQIALKAFHGYGGHYHADPRLDDRLCDQVYGDWAYRSCAGDSPDHVIVTEVDGRLAGFATAKMVHGEGLSVLSGVDPAFRRRGVYRSLNIARMQWFRSQGAARMWSPTLAANVATQRTYVKAGLVHSHACYTFHKWFDEEDRARFDRRVRGDPARS